MQVFKILSLRILGNIVLIFEVNSLRSLEISSLKHNLPFPFQYEKWSLCKLSKNLMEEVNRQINSISILKEIDDTFHVTFPNVKYNFSLPSRRFYVSHLLSISLSISSSSAKPQINFIGKNCQEMNNLWKSFPYDEKLSFVSNLCQCFDTIIDKNLHIDDLSCSICYCAEIEGEKIDFFCQNESCLSPYHMKCLTEWVKSTNQKFENSIIYGKCIMCNQVICIVILGIHFFTSTHPIKFISIQLQGV